MNFKESSADFRGVVRGRAARALIAFAGVLGCLWGFWFAARDGASQLLSGYALIAHLPAAASEAVRLQPANPVAHHSQAMVLLKENQFSLAIQELKLAVSLRPRDYSLWQLLARTLDQEGDRAGALAAARETVRLAPYYGEPRWELGNLLLRAGQRDEAFTELRRAAHSDPTLFLNLIDLAWTHSGGDAGAVEKLINPQTAEERLELAGFFVRRGKTAEAVALFRAAGAISEADRQSLLNELLIAKRFAEAYEVWSGGREQGVSALPDNNAGVLHDGGFESQIALDEPGFNWQLARGVQAVRLARDPNEPRAGRYSLRLEYSGDAASSPGSVTQLVLVEPGARYRLSFAARTQELLSGGMPLLLVSDAKNDGHMLGQSPPLPQNTGGWQNYTVEFSTPENVTVVLLSLQRQSCSTAPCPIFGRLWLDDFSLHRL